MTIKSELQKAITRVSRLFSTEQETPPRPLSNPKSTDSKPVPATATRREGNAEVTERALKIRTFKTDVYERLASTTILSKLEPLLKNTQVAIDVGGNVGHIAYFLSKHAKQVYTFEAVGVVFEQLEKLPALAPNVIPEKCAISDFVGEAEFFVDHNRLSNSGLHNVGAVDVPFKPKTEFKTTKTKVKSIDSMGHRSVGFVKIDVEGSELDVLKGAENTIQESHPDFLVEIFEPFCKYPAEEIFEFLFARGYQCFYYDKETSELAPVADTAAGVDAVKHKHELHDGDFLFTCKEIASFAKAA